MARISTGQTYGDTNRSTAAQLLGGIPMDATPGAIAQGAITAPSPATGDPSPDVSASGGPDPGWGPKVLCATGPAEPRSRHGEPGQSPGWL